MSRLSHLLDFGRSKLRKALILLRSGKGIEIFQRLIKSKNLSYENWLEKNYGPQSVFLSLVEGFPIEDRLKISVLIPVYNSDPRWLREAVASVQTQSYENWELILSDDFSRPATKLVLEEITSVDPRIKLIHNNSHEHISGTLNNALKIAAGQYVLVLDHDDCLHPSALALIALSVKANPGLKLIYSDEDKIDTRGRHYDPYFKPDWNPDLLTSQNYINHMTAFEATFLRTLGGFRKGYEGAQDWDLLLRAEPFLCPSQVMHLPVILYHWRAVKGSTALNADQKEYIQAAQLKTMKAYLLIKGIDGTYESSVSGHWNLRRTVRGYIPKATVIIPTKDNVLGLKQCLKGVVEKAGIDNLEILVIQNQSSKTKELNTLANQYNVRLIRCDDPFNYAQLNNLAAQEAEGEHLIFLNDDVEILTQNWLGEMLAQSARPEIGAVGAMLYYPDNFIQHAGVVLGIGGVAGHIYQGFARGFAGPFGRASLVQNYSAVTAAWMAMEKKKFQQAGGFDEDNLAVAFNDVDLCLKILQLGYRNIWLPSLEAVHRESVSRGSEDARPETLARFENEYAFMRRKWGDLLNSDPAYNPNLSLDTQNGNLASFPRLNWLEALNKDN